MRNKVGGAFATGASVSNGKEVTILGIFAAMFINQMIVVSGGGGFGASATTGPDSPGIDEKEVGEARNLGKRIAEVAAIVKRGIWQVTLRWSNGLKRLLHFLSKSSNSAFEADELTRAARGASVRRPETIDSKDEGEIMTRVLLLGYDPDTVEFSDPALPPGMTAEKVPAGIDVAMKQLPRADGRRTSV